MTVIMSQLEKVFSFLTAANFNRIEQKDMIVRSHTVLEHASLSWISEQKASVNSSKLTLVI